MRSLIFILVACLFISTYAQTHTSPVTIDRSNEIMFKLQDSNGYYSGLLNMNDGLGNMAIKLGNNGVGQHIVTGYGAAEVLWGGHNGDGYVSLNASQTGVLGETVVYTIGLLVDSETNTIRIGAPNNEKGFFSGQGVAIANATGDLITNKIKNRDSEGLDVDLGSYEGDIYLYDAGGTQYILGDQVAGQPTGIVLRTTTNPSQGDALFVVESSGHAERLRVEHDGALSTTNYLEVNGGGNSYIKGRLAVKGTDIPAGYDFAVDGKAIMEEVKVKMSGSWPDYVFAPEYELKSLKETESFITENHHLPNMPSAEEVAENGISLGEMNRLLVEKVEELTLYLLEIKSENEDLSNRLSKMEALITTDD